MNELGCLKDFLASGPSSSSSVAFRFVNACVNGRQESIIPFALAQAAYEIQANISERTFILFGQCRFRTNLFLTYTNV